MRRTFVFYNPILVATRGRRELITQIERMLRDGRSDEVQVAPTFSATSAGAQAAEAVEAGFDRVWVCGGDGTVFQVLQGIAGKRVALGVIPLGTGNVIAQNLGLPRNPMRAAEMLEEGEARDTFLGRYGGQPEGFEVIGSRQVSASEYQFKVWIYRYVPGAYGSGYVRLARGTGTSPAIRRGTRGTTMEA